MQPTDFGKILDNIFGEGAGKGAEAMYQEITDTKNYPVMHNSLMPEILKKAARKSYKYRNLGCSKRSVIHLISIASRLCDAKGISTGTYGPANLGSPKR